MLRSLSRRFEGSSWKLGTLAGAAAGIAGWCLAASLANASNNFDGQGNNNWWFDYVNWSKASPTTVVDPLTNGLLPPNNEFDPNVGLLGNDAQINGGSGAWDVTGEGVVFDPDNDPFYSNPDVVDDDIVNGSDFLQLQRSGLAPSNWSRQFGGTGYGAEDMAYPTEISSGPFSVNIGGGQVREMGPQTLYRMYISRNTTNSNTLTIKSGDLAVGSTIIVGRSGSTSEAQNLGQVVQTGGIFRIPSNTLDMGQSESSGWGNGTYDYRGGTLEVQQYTGAGGIRLSAGSSTTGAGGIGKFIMHNPMTGGRVHTFDFTLAAIANLADGVERGVGIVEFHLENGGTRPIQVDQNLAINNGADSTDPTWIRSARLDLVLDEAPATDGGGVPVNLGLFDVDFESVYGGTITGTGDLGLDGDPLVHTNDRIFSDAAGTTHYSEGDTVSAVFGGTQYNWTITYTGDISWTDAANSVVDQVLGAGNGTDVVLVGLSSAPAAALAAVPEPATVALALLGTLAIAARRRRR
ncbi:MAG: PEP-CTERM sorting domain-containing protein [Planctomycetales bacterium]|nr:PEP-CTERM sorting domain-containing protein [Planctomycetales bacterium]